MWGWPVGVYLFLGGLSSGTFVTVAVLQLAHGGRFARTTRWGSLLCVGALLLGIFALVADIGVPLRALNMVASFSHVSTSWMARGAWALLGCGILFGAYALLAWLPAGGALAPWLRQYRQPVLNLLGILGLPFAVFLGLYTGRLLGASMGIESWRTPLLAALFLLSAFETGCTCVTAILGSLERTGMALRRTVRRLDAMALLLMVAEACTAAAYAHHVVATGTLTAILSKQGSLTATVTLCLVFLVALLSCILLTALHLLLRRRGGTCGRAVAMASCTAGIALRFTILSVGVHTSPLAIW